MFTIKVADVIIGIEYKYPYVRRLCADYCIEDAEPEFIVSVSNEEILQEQENSPVPCSLPYAESLCIFRGICNKLIDYDAFLMHAAVIAVDSEAYVFAAKSGTGKTTHMKLWMEEFGGRAQVVNGDKPVFRFMNGTLYACGTPWRGKEELGGNIIRPVKAVCFLEQSGNNRIRLLKEDEIVSRIFHQMLVPKEEKSVTYFFDMVDRMLATIPFYLLQCNRDPQAALLAYQEMSGGSGQDKR